MGLQLKLLWALPSAGSSSVGDVCSSAGVLGCCASISARQHVYGLLLLLLLLVLQVQLIC